jgi:hypothetical protein
MLRFVLEVRTRDSVSGCEWVDLHTVDAAVPGVEERLRDGGIGEAGFKIWRVVGVEVRDSAAGISAVTAVTRVQENPPFARGEVRRTDAAAPTLTDEEREAIEGALFDAEARGSRIAAAILRDLLARLGGER